MSSPEHTPNRLPAPSDIAPAEVADFADECATYIDEHGWIQNALGDVGRACCAMGTLIGTNHVRTGRYSPNAHGWAMEIRMEHEIVDFLGLHHSDGVKHPIATWNDTEGRTQDEVTQMFRDLATKHRPDETGATL